MGVKVREKVKGSGEWWVFINHRPRSRSRSTATCSPGATGGPWTPWTTRRLHRSATLPQPPSRETT